MKKEPKTRDSLYPQINNRSMPIKEMSFGYIKNELKRIKHVKVNTAYRKALNKELMSRFRTLHDEKEEN